MGKSERQHVCVQINDLARLRAGTVTGIFLHPNQNRRFSSVLCLELSGELGGVGVHDAIVVIVVIVGGHRSHFPRTGSSGVLNRVAARDDHATLACAAVPSNSRR